MITASFALCVVVLYVVCGITFHNALESGEVDFAVPKIVGVEKILKHKINPYNRPTVGKRVLPAAFVSQYMSDIGLWKADSHVPGDSVVSNVGDDFVVFIVDAARSMLEPSRGDIDGFKRVKQELVTMVSELNSGSMFNVLVFSDGLDLFSLKPIMATAEQKKLVADWMDDYWRYEGTRLVGSPGVRFRNYVPDFTGYPIRRNQLKFDTAELNVDVRKEPLPKLDGRYQGVGTSRLDMALFAAFELRADTIFLITDGTPKVAYEYTSEGLQNFQSELRAWYKRRDQNNSAGYLNHNEALRKYYKKVSGYQRDRLAKGLPMEVNESGLPGGIEKPSIPGEIDLPEYNPEFGEVELVEILNRKARDEYIHKANRGLPALHIIGYSTDDKAEAFLKNLQREFPNSRFRRIGGMDTQKYVQELGFSLSLP